MIRGLHLLRALFAIGLTALALILLCGCTKSRAERQADTEKRDTYAISGTASIPGLGPVPVSLVIDRTGSERLVEQSETKTQIDGAAIGQQIAAVVGKGMDAVIAKVAGIQPKSAVGGLEGLLGLLGTGGGGAAVAYAIREALARRRLEVEYGETKRDRDEGWKEAVENAKRIRPEDLAKTAS